MKKFYPIFLTSLLLFNLSFGQSLIDPTTGGGFETGSTFASNGWTVVNSSDNKWVIGTATKLSGTQSAYISDDNGTSNAYDNTTAHISHFYTDVTIPAGVSVANLEWWVQGEIEGSNDRLELYLDPSLTNPIADALPGGGAFLLQAQSSSNANYIRQTANIAAFAGTTIRIIFTWVNDGNSLGLDPPASVDAVTLCLTPTKFNVTGGGGFCIGGTGVHIGLSNSDSGVDYQLFNGATPVGAAIPGTGSPLDFGLIATAGTYTVKATAGAPCNLTETMNGNAVVIVNPLPTVNAGSDFTKTCVANASGATIGEANDPAATYSWSPALGLSSSTVSNPIANPTLTTTYTLTKTITATGCFDTDDVIVTVNNSLPTVSAGSPFTKTCSNNATGATIGEANDLTATYSWSPALGLSSSTVSNPNANPTLTTTYTVTKTTIANGCFSTASVIVTVDNTNPAVSITGGAFVCIGGTTTLSPTTGGTWTSSNASVASVTNAGVVTGVSNGSATFTFTSSANGCSNSTAAVTVNPTPDVNSVANITLCKGAASGAINFTGAVVGTVYSWTNSNTAIGLAASGTGNIASFVANNAGTGPISATITVTPSYTNGVTCTGTPITFTITVNPTATVNAISNQTLCNNATVTAINFSSPTTGGTIVYNWVNNAPSIGLAASGAGNIASFVATNSGTAPVTATITVTPSYTNNSVTCTGTPIAFTITVNPTPTVNAVANQAICKGSNTTAVSFSGAVPGTVFNWTNSNTSIGFASASGTGNIPAFTGVNSGTTPVTATFTVTPSYTNNGVTCTGTPLTYTITVNPTPNVNPAPANQTVCNNTNTAAISFAGDVSGTTFNWTNSDNTIGLASSGTGNIAAFSAVNTGASAVTAVITVTPSANSCPGSPIAFTIRVNPTPTVNVVSNQAVCNGAPVAAITFSGTVTPTTYNWTNNTPSIGLAASGTGNIASFTGVNSGASNVVATITVTPTSSGCPGTPKTFTITVFPTPTVTNPGNQAVCAGTNTTAVTFAGTGTTYDWTNSNPGIGLAASGTGNIAAFAATNATSSPVTATITVTPKANGCNGTAVPFTITVNPKPVIAGPINDSICSFSTFAISPLDGTDGVVPSGTTYTWGIPVQQVPVTGGAAGSGSSISGVLTNADSLFSNVANIGTPHNATYTVTPTAGTCAGTAFQLVVTVKPNPPKGDASFFQNCTSNLQTFCDGTLVGGGGQDDADVQFQPGCVRPTTSRLDNQGFDWDWEYSNTNTPYNFSSSPGVTTVFYQHVFPPRPSVYSTLGDHYIRFYLTKNNCTTYSDTILIRVTSTISLEAGGPYVNCVNPGPITLSGASVGGTSTLGPATAQWSIISGGGTLSTTALTASPQTVTYTPAVGFVGTAKLLLKSIDPDGVSICNSVIDTAYIIIPPTGTLPLCISPANWTLTGNGTLDQSNAACATLTLVGGNSGSGSTSNTDYTICSGAGNFSFDWSFTAPAAEGATPVWQSADQKVATGAGVAGGNMVVNAPTNISAGNIIIVMLHARDNIGSITSPAGFNLIRRETSGSNGNDNRGTVISYWKVATASEPATYTFRGSSMGNGDTWALVSGRVTGADTTNPVDGTAGTNQGTTGVTTRTIPGITTTGPNRLLIAGLSIIDDDHTLPLTKPAAMTTRYEANSNLGDQITYGGYTQNLLTAGAFGGTLATSGFTWTNSDAAAAQMFALKPAFVLDDSAMVIVNGVQTILTGSNGASGTFTQAVNSNDVIGLRVKTRTNQGGAGRLTFYNVNVPNDAPVLTGTPAITVPISNPPIPASYFVPPTVSDNCGTKVRLADGYPQTGVVNNVGCTNTQTRTWIYQDSCGLQSTPFIQTITWTTDLTQPILTVPSAQVFCVSAGPNYTIPTASATDNCAGTITISYSITGATTRSGTGNNASGTFNTGISTITWTATDANGNSITNTTTVDVRPVPTATISLSGSGTICNNGSSTLSVTLTGTGPWNIKYSTGGPAITVTGITSSPYIINTGALTTSTTYVLTEVTDATPSCPGTVSGSVTVTVRPVPTAVISGTAAICAGSSATLSIAPTGTSPWSVTYTDGVTPVTVNGITSTPYTFSVSPAVTRTYTITAFNDANCPGTSSGSAVITVNPIPTITVSSTAPNVCNGSSSTLTASGASTYTWAPGTGLSATTGTSVVATPSITTTYTVTGTASGCSNTATTTINVTAGPVTTGATICQGGTATISSSTTCPGGGQTTTAATNAGRGVDSTGVGTSGWTNPGNITAVGTPFATNTFTGGTGPIATRYLKASNYGFSIPNGATIDGITVTINRRVTLGSPNMRDFVVRLVNASGVVVGENKALTAAAWPTTLSPQVYPNPTFTDPLWASTWTPADVNDPDFGVVLSVSNSTALARTLEVDYIQITVTYTLNGVINWYSASSGGTFYGSGSPFNPVPSVMANTNTSGTTTLYAECSSVPGCRTATNFTISAPSDGGAISSTPVCAASPGTLTLTGYTGSVVQWERSTDGGSTWTTIANTTDILNYVAAASTVEYRALVQSGLCTPAYSGVTTVGIHNLWTGTTSSDWNTGSNWSDGQVPSVACPNVVIQSGTPFQPVLGSGVAAINNLVINASASLTVTGAKLQLTGTITNNGTLNTVNGTLEFNGNTAQNISGSWLVNKTVNSLVVTNPAGLTVSGVANDSLKIIDSLSFGNVNNAVLNTGDNVILVSALTTTARVSDITNGGVNSGNHFNGKVTVQRFYPGNRSWRLITSPLSNTGNIYDSWQNGGVYTVGKGMFVTGPGPNATNGLDNSGQNNYSMKGWDIATQSYTNIGNTKDTVLSGNTATAANKAFFTFVRGDRSRTPDNTIIPNTNNTTLSSAGNLQIGAQTFTASPVAGKFAMVGNPYASPIDFSKLTRNNLVNRFTAWDPLINDVGGYIVVDGATGNPTPASPGGQNNIIQSSQGFFVETAAAGTASITVNEQHKSKVINFGMFRPMPSQNKKLVINLYKFRGENGRYLADGNLTEFDDQYSDSYNSDDAPKFINVNETFGLLKDSKSLAIQKRPILRQTDTLLLKLTKTTARKYQFELAASDLAQENLAGFVEDTYLNKLIPINMSGNTTVDFEIKSDPASAAPDRFRIIFNPSVTYTNLDASVVETNIEVKWGVLNEFNIREYEIERSTDGVNFTRVSSDTAKGNDRKPVDYKWIDMSPTPGDYYYRIRSVSHNEVIGYSNIVKVKIKEIPSAMYVFPNPVTNSTIHLQMNNQKGGVYRVRLINNLGQVIFNKYLIHGPGSSAETIKSNRRIVPGNYHLEITSPDKKVNVINVNAL